MRATRAELRGIQLASHWSLPSTEISLSRARRFNVNAARPVIPEPAKKSATTSPGFVNVRMKGWIAPIGTFVR